MTNDPKGSILDYRYTDDILRIMAHEIEAREPDAPPEPRVVEPVKDNQKER